MNRILPGKFGKFGIFSTSKSAENGQFSCEIREFSGLKRFFLVLVTIVTRRYSVKIAYRRQIDITVE